MADKALLLDDGTFPHHHRNSRNRAALALPR